MNFDPNKFLAFESSMQMAEPWAFYNMVLYKSVLIILGEKEWAGWLIQKSDLA